MKTSQKSTDQRLAKIVRAAKNSKQRELLEAKNLRHLVESAEELSDGPQQKKLLSDVAHELAALLDLRDDHVDRQSLLEFLQDQKQAVRKAYKSWGSQYHLGQVNILNEIIDRLGGGPQS